VAKHKQQWTVELVKEAHDQLDVHMRNMQDLRLCVVVVTEARVPAAALPPCPVALGQPHTKLARFHVQTGRHEGEGAVRAHVQAPQPCFSEHGRECFAQS
jgi:hypothetical protein